MNAWTTSCAGSLVGWLADYYALATLLLFGSWLAWRWIRQPARRLAIAWMLVGELLVLAVVCALPGWPRFSLITAAAPKAIAERPAVEEPPLARPPMPVAPEAEPEHGSGDALRSDVAEAPAPAVPSWPRFTGTQWLAAGYLAGAALVVLWLSWGAVATAWLCRRARPAGPSLRAELLHVVPAAGPMPRLFVSPQVANAVALGVLRPTIVLPAGLAESGPPETLRAVLAHEWAHLRHRDLWLLALGRFLLIGLYAHPLLWWLRRAIRSDQELLADALAAGDNRPQYAEELLAAVRRAARPTTMSVSAAVGIWEGSSQLSRRIAMLLDETFRVEPAGSRRWRFQALAWLVLAGAACSLVTLQPAPSTAEPIPAEPIPGDAVKTRGGDEYLHGEVYTVTAASANGKVYTGTAASAKDDPLPYLPGYSLLMQRGVVKALDLSDEQKNKLRASASKYMAANMEFYAKRKGLSEDARMKARAQWDAEQQKATRTEVEAILTPRQSQVLQWFGLCEAAYGRLNELDPNLSQKLGLTKEQQLAVSSVRKAANDRMHRYLKQNQDKMLAVLSPEQRTRLRAAALGPLRLASYSQTAMKIPGRTEPIWVPSLFPYGDFSDASLQKALGLTADQQKRVRERLENHDTLGQELAAQWQKLPAAEQEKWSRGQNAFYTYTFTTVGGRSSSSAEEKKRQAEFDEKLKKERQKSRAELENQPLVKKSIELRQQFEGLLTPKQLAQYQDMAVQNSLGSALMDPLMQLEIGASGEQKAAIQRLQMENYEAIQQVSREMGEKMLKLLTPAQQEQLRAEIERQRGAPSAPPAKDKTKAGGTTKVGAGRLVLSGNNTYAGGFNQGAPLAYDDYDKSFWIDWGRHVVALPTPPDLYGPRSIRLPAYALLMQRSVQEQLNLTAEQKQRLREISAKHESESKKITEEDQKTAAEREKWKKELDDLSKKMAKARALAEGSATTAGGYSWSGVGLVWSKEVLEKLERQEQDTRRQIEEVLTPAQLETLKEATFRTFAFGSGIMLQPKVQEELGLDQNQRDSLRQLDERLQKEKAERLRSMTREKIARILAVLTPQQWANIRKSVASWWESPRLDYSTYPVPHLDGNDALADELGLSAAQRKQVWDIVSKAWKEKTRLEEELKKFSLQDEKALKANGERSLQLLAEMRKQVEATLTPAQLAAVKEMALQNSIVPYLGIPPRRNPSEKKGLGDQQRKVLQEIRAEYADKPQQIYGKLTDKALAALTPAQQQMLRAEIDRRGW